MFVCHRFWTDRLVNQQRLVALMVSEHVPVCTCDMLHLIWRREKNWRDKSLFVYCSKHWPNGAYVALGIRCWRVKVLVIWCDLVLLVHKFLQIPTLSNPAFQKMFPYLFTMITQSNYQYGTRFRRPGQDLVGVDFWAFVFFLACRLISR